MHGDYAERDDDAYDEDGDPVCEPTPLMSGRGEWTVFVPDADVGVVIGKKFYHCGCRIASGTHGGEEGVFVSTGDYELYAYLIDTYHRGDDGQEETVRE